MFTLIFGNRPGGYICRVRPLACRDCQPGNIHRCEQSELKITNPVEISVIVIDDDEAVRDSLCVMLSLAGLHVTTCKSGAELLQRLGRTLPDCLVVDIHMPAMTGLELVARLNAAGFEIPVILISGNMDAATTAQAHGLGVSHLLKKPFHGMELITIVKDIIG